MAKTPQARPALLSANAVLAILIGAAGTLLFGYYLISPIGGLLGAPVGPLVVMGLIISGGPLLITLTMLRWGLAVMSDRSTMAYFPGRAARVGRYGAVTGVLTLLVSIPFGLSIFLLFGGVEINWFSLAYLLVVVNAIGMIVFGGRIDRRSKA